jgi:hypothetical protein
LGIRTIVVSMRVFGSFLAAVFLSLLFINPAMAQQLQIDPCDPTQNEVIDEELCSDEPEVCYDDQEEIVDCEEETDEVTGFEKGETSDETVAGTEEVFADQGGAVLGDSTEAEVLAETGSLTTLSVATGAIIILMTLAVQRISTLYRN